MFLKKSLLPAALAASFIASLGALATPIPDSAKIGGVAIGCQSWSFKLYTVSEAIEKTAEAGGKIIELYPGQPFSKEDKTKLGPDMTEAQVNALKAKLEKCGVRAVNFGVVHIPKDEAQARKIFDFAKKLDLYAITTEATGSIDTIEKLVKEYDIRVGFHNHAKRDKYNLWNPAYIRDLVKDRDSRIGAAADIGHWATDRTDAVEGFKILEGRIVSIHAKDREVLGSHSTCKAFGAGVLNFPAIFDELKRQNFVGNVSIEFESNWDKSVPEIAQSVGFVRGYTAKAK